MSNRKIGMWLYNNAGGDVIAEKIMKKLQDRDIETMNDVNLRQAISLNGDILYENKNLNELDLFFNENISNPSIMNLFAITNNTITESRENGISFHVVE